MSFSVIIPARYASTRLPAKPLALIAGITMVEHVYRRAVQSGADTVAIATDDERIARVAESFGARVVMTSLAHQSGTDRLHEAAQKLGFSDDDIIVNVQGDEPLIPPSVIAQVAQNLGANVACSIATLSAALQHETQLFEASVVKVVADKQGHALYFSRAAIPYSRQHFPAIPPDLAPWQRHIGIYAYRCRFLSDFVQWPVAPLEQLESLEQLRALWNGHRIHVQMACETPPAGIDTAEDLQRVRALLETV